MSTETKPSVPPAAGGAGLFQRVSSFLIGAGLTALVTQYFIYEEVKAGNRTHAEKAIRIGIASLSIGEESEIGKEHVRVKALLFLFKENALGAAKKSDSKNIGTLYVT